MFWSPSHRFWEASGMPPNRKTTPKLKKSRFSGFTLFSSYPPYSPFVGLTILLLHPRQYPGVHHFITCSQFPCITKGLINPKRWLLATAAKCRSGQAVIIVAGPPPAAVSNLGVWGSSVLLCVAFQ